MPVVVSLRIDDRLLDLATPEILDMGRIFEVDSMSLLLGKNGSGKTRLLNLIAEAISTPGHSGSMVYVKSRGGDISLLTEDETDLCAIYYSGLPYRRKLSRRGRLIDASPNNNTEKLNEEHGRMRQLGEVAAALGIYAQLKAKLAYSKNIHRSIIVPALKQARHIDSPILLTLISNLKSLESGSIKDPDRLKELDRQIEVALKSVVRFVEDHIEEHLPGRDYIYYLSVLESLYAHEDYDGEDYALSFLSYLGLVKAGYFKELEVVQDLVDSSREAIRNYGGMPTYTERSISFVIEGVDQFNAIRQYDAPIKIEWGALSSGLQALIDQFAHLGDAIDKAARRGHESIVLMIDEGDAYLHLDWQRKYVTLLNRYLGKLKRFFELRSLQVILASHSPIVAADMPGLFVTNLDSDSRIKTFGAPIEDVISGSFESSSLGEFAASKINEIYDRVRKNKLSSADRKLIDEIGDEAIRSVLMRGR
ncbi:AAA family ATPase [Pseudomonas putida]|uniref:AAA family ATPase n=1 Tax=Pseudomonas TaxID=286 RepID=UPI0034671B84